MSHLTWQEWGWILCAMLCLYYHLRVVFSLKLDRQKAELALFHNDREVNRIANERDNLRQKCSELEKKLMGGGTK